jgi:hypothetical protein
LLDNTGMIALHRAAETATERATTHALAMGALGKLAAGIRPKDSVSGDFFVAFKPDLFQSMDDYGREITKRIETIKATPRMVGVQEIRTLVSVCRPSVVASWLKGLRSTLRFSAL